MTTQLTTMILDSNERFSPINENASILVENIASNVLYRKDAAKSKSNTSFSFSVDTTDMFIDRGVIMTINKIPFLIKNEVDAIKGPINNFNFMEKVFGNYKDFCLKQYSFANAIDTLQVNFGERIVTMNNAELLKILSNYYEKDQIHKYLDASAPDYLYSSNLHTTTTGRVPTLDVDGSNMVFLNAIPSVDINSPFSAMVNSEYSTRRPIFQLIQDIPAAAGDADLTDSTISVNLKNINCFLPFNVFGINETTPLYNVDKIQVTVNLYNDWWSRIFSTVPKNMSPLSPDYKVSKYTIRLNTAIGIDSSDVNLFVRMYSPSSDVSVDKNKPYIIGYPIVEKDAYVQDIVFSGKQSVNVNSIPFDLRSIPKKFFISVRPKCSTNDEHLLNNEHYCRWNNLRIEFLGSTTEIATGNSADYLYQFCKNKGLNCNKETACFLRGFPICVDVSDDLGCSKTAAKIGLNLSNTSGKYTVRISGNISRLHTDFSSNSSTATEAELFFYNEKIYELSVIFIYQGYIAHGIAGKKFSNIEYLSADSLANLNGSLNSLVESFVPRANVLGSGVGGSWWTAAASAAKNALGRGVNLVKSIINDPDLRNRLIKASEGKSGGRNGVYSNIIGGNVELDSHLPILGAGSLSNWNTM